MIIHKQLMFMKIQKIIIQKIINKERKVLIVFDDMIADIESHKNLSPIVTEFFLRVRKLDISLVHKTID